MPDFFKGSPVKMEWYTNPTEENQQNINNFMTTHADPTPIVEKILHKSGIMDEMKTKYSQVTSWGVIGYCWGGKITALVSKKGTPFSCAVQTSPALLEVSDAEKAEIPMAILASNEENAETVKAYGEALTVAKHVETWKDNLHGWMSARHVGF
jgi:dienelactone hydrolase